MKDDPIPEGEEYQDIFEHYRFTADKGQKPLRVDKFLLNLISGPSRNKIQQAAEAGNILVNEQSVKSNYKVKPEDTVRIVLAYPPPDKELKPQNLDLHIEYEDNDVIIINKQAGMVVHPGVGNPDGTLVNGLLHHLQSLPGKETERPGLVHRLDKDTSGIMVIAANEIAMANLARQFFERTTGRTYQALVWGDLEQNEGTITGHIGRSEKERKHFRVYPEGEEGKHAVTHYKVLERFGYVTLVECRLETGRTHQIRVHFQYIGHPLFMDKFYGGDQVVKGPSFSKYRQFVENCFALCPRQALHAKTLEFEHPTRQERLRFDSALPTDMAALLEKWRRYQVPY